MEAKKESKFVNGVNIDQLFATLDLIKQNPEMVKMAQNYSPVFNTITKSAPVKVQLDKS